jgi:hypothetical protein
VFFGVDQAHGQAGTGVASAPAAVVLTQAAGVDSAWEQEKLEAWKMLKNAAESPASSARCVGQ